MAKSKSLTVAEQTILTQIKTDINTNVNIAAVNGITIQTAVEIFKDALDKSIIAAGDKGKESLIRSQEPIKIFHEVIKQELIKNNVRQGLIFPAVGNSHGEIKLFGYFKDKNQDVCVLPNNANPSPEVLTSGLLHGSTDPLGQVLTEAILTINVRSQMSSIAKNIDTMFERIFAEPLNLHMRCPNIVMGEFYIIPTTGYDSDKVKLKNPAFCPKVTTTRNAAHKTTAQVIEEYILAFQSVNDRNAHLNEEYKYEKVCLLIVDFTTTPIKIYQTTQDLINDNLLPPNTIANYDNLSFNNFTTDLLRVYVNRFGTGKFI